MRRIALVLHSSLMTCVFVPLGSLLFSLGNPCFGQKVRIILLIKWLVFFRALRPLLISCFCQNWFCYCGPTASKKLHCFDVKDTCACSSFPILKASLTVLILQYCACLCFESMSHLEIFTMLTHSLRVLEAFHAFLNFVL